MRKQEFGELARQFQLGNELAFTRIIQLVAPSVVNGLQSKFPLHLVEDAFQEATFKFYQQLKSGVIQPDNLSGWMYRVTYNECLNIIRKQKTKENAESNFLSHYQIEASQDPEMLQEMDEKLRKALLLLGEECQKLLKLAYFEELSSREIASKLGYASEFVVNTLKGRCRRRLREIFLEL